MMTLDNWGHVANIILATIALLGLLGAIVKFYMAMDTVTKSQKFLWDEFKAYKEEFKEHVDDSTEWRNTVVELTTEHNFLCCQDNPNKKPILVPERRKVAR